MDEQLTTRQVAEALRVSESTVKRWCNCGAIPTVRTLGGHRRIPMAGLLEFLEATNRAVQRPLFQKDTGRLADEPTQPAGAKFSTTDLDLQLKLALEAGDEMQCRGLLSTIYSAEENFAVVADRYIATAFHKIGQRWNCGDIEIYQERRACEICNRLLHELRRLIPEAADGAPLAMGGSPAGDHYTLPSQLVDLVLRENHWRTMNLGANLPLSTFEAAVREHRPKLLWLSVSHVEGSLFAAEYQALRAHLPRDLLVVVGGRALNDELRPQLSYTAYCDNMQQLASFAKAVHGT